MKKFAIAYGISALVLYLVGLAPFARNYLQNDFAMTAEGFRATSIIGIIGNLVYIDGQMDTFNKEQKILNSKAAILEVNLKYDGNVAPMRFVSKDNMPITTSLDHVTVETGIDVTPAAKKRSGGVYVIQTRWPDAFFIVDSRSTGDPKIIRPSYSTAYARSKNADDRLIYYTVLAHIVDFVSAPIQATVILLGLFSPMSHWP